MLNTSLHVLLGAKSYGHQIKMDVNCERNILVLRIVITVKFPVGLCSQGVAVQTGAQGELALDYKLNRGIKDCTVQVRMKTFSPMIFILVNVFPPLTEAKMRVT